MFFKKIVNTYLSLLYKYPIKTQAVQTGALMGMGDLLAQTVVQKKDVSVVDWQRCARYCTIGLVLVGPCVGKWIMVLERVNGKGGLTSVLKKTAIDQCCFAPIFLGIVVSTIGISSGNTVDETVTNLRENYVDILLTNYKVWPLVQVLNFLYVPLHFRVLFVQTVGICWNVYLSWKLSYKYENVPETPILENIDGDDDYDSNEEDPPD